MSRPPHPHRPRRVIASLPPRAVELLADRLTGDVGPGEAGELEALLQGRDDASVELAAASALVADLPRVEPLPESLRAALIRMADEVAADAAAERGVRAAASVSVARHGGYADGWSIASERGRRGSGSLWLGLAAAAGFALAAAGWWPRLVGPGAVEMTPAQRLEALALSAPDVVVQEWSDFVHPDHGAPPELRGVRGNVVWSESRGEGYIRLAGLRPNDPTVEQYQLWVIDDRGIEQRVSGGVFDAPASGEVTVAVDPAARVKNARAFAVTIEPSGGVAVSDLSRRACLAVVAPLDLTLADRRASLMRNNSRVAMGPWTDFVSLDGTSELPELTGVSGDVVWDEPGQRGYMVFHGLRVNDPKVEQYQLWIVDERGLGQRVSGGVFDASPTGPTIVPISPGLPVRNAAIFAVTIEPPGGVAVSSMARRVCLAKVGV
ncbi:MAG: anti-sigma factor [Phycisphaeraceae bacterium]|nr:MAG: anti-sigma factor [Phycisphaeraceae bacterium]